MLAETLSDRHEAVTGVTHGAGAAIPAMRPLAKQAVSGALPLGASPTPAWPLRHLLAGYTLQCLIHDRQLLSAALLLMPKIFREFTCETEAD